MHSARRFSLLLLLIFAALFVFDATARAADDDESYDDYDVTARVMRLSYLRGDVSLRRAGETRWESARLNYPLVEGDTLATGSDSRVEIQIDSRNFMRLAENTVLRVVTLRDEGIALSLSEGKATLRIARFDHAREYFEVDAPKTTVAVEKTGLYRLDVGRDNVQVVVRDDGRARIYSETSGFTLRDGRSASLSYGGAEEGDWQLAYAPARDLWDDWVNERERYLAARLRYDDRTRYYDADVWGAEELDAYGDWTYAGSYGWVWRPHVTVINNYYNWAPYRHGHWVWCPPYGWTWVAEEPWGWAPYHYGRWVYYNNNWCWAPRGVHYKRVYWRPALVAFIYVPTSYGERLAWYPLYYGQRDPHARSYRQQQPARLAPLRSEELARLERINPVALRAVTTVPARSFGTEGARGEAASAEIARRAVTGEPVRGRLPIVPARTDNNSANGGERPVRQTGPARPASLGPAASLPERPTGAGERRVGVPLDNELRRTRLYNNREPRPSSSAGVTTPGTGVAGGERDTGAVVRPARPARIVRPGDSGNNGGSVTPDERPARPARPDLRRAAPTGDGNNGVQPEVRPTPERREGARPPRRETGTPPDTGGRPERRERPAPSTPRPDPPKSEPPQRSSPPPARQESPREQPAPARPAPPPARDDSARPARPDNDNF
ncbi:MAG TPA: DUF6600 domain-containing protein [Pyrinomonadaceae bacterium]